MLHAFLQSSGGQIRKEWNPEGVETQGVTFVHDMGSKLQRHEERLYARHLQQGFLCNFGFLVIHV